MSVDSGGGNCSTPVRKCASKPPSCWCSPAPRDWKTNLGPWMHPSGAVQNSSCWGSSMRRLPRRRSRNRCAREGSRWCRLYCHRWSPRANTIPTSPNSWVRLCGKQPKAPIATTLTSQYWPQYGPRLTKKLFFQNFVQWVETAGYGAGGGGDSTGISRPGGAVRSGIRQCPGGGLVGLTQPQEIRETIGGLKLLGYVWQATETSACQPGTPGLMQLVLAEVPLPTLVNSSEFSPGM